MEPRPPNRSAGRWAHLGTYGAEVLVLLGTVAVFKLAVLRFGTEGFEPYTVVRRTISFLQTVLLFGLGVALVRFVAMARSVPEQVGLLRTVAKPLGLVCAAVLVLCAALPETLSELFFGDRGHGALLPPVGLLTVGLLLHALIYSYWRGQLYMHQANLLQVVNLGVVPCAAMWWGPDLPTVLWATGAAWCVCSGAGLVPVLFAKHVAPASTERARLLRYGLPRVPGDLVLASLLTVPVYLVNHVNGLGAGAQVAFGLTLVNLASSVYSPLSLLLLPTASGLLAAKRWADLEARTARTAWTALLSAMAMLCVFQLVASPLLQWYLGPTGEAMVGTSRIVFIGAVFMAVFIALRSLLDAYYAAPRNTFNLLAAFGLFLAGGAVYLFWWPVPLVALVATVLLPLALLALLTWRSIAWMRQDLRTMGAEGAHDLRVLVVIPGSDGVAGMPFSHRQAAAIAAMPGFTATTFLLTTRTRLRGLLRARRELKSVERKLRPDVVHVHYGTVTALFTLLTVRCPVVVTFHGSDLNPTPSDGVWRDRTGRLFSQLAALGAAGIICVSEGLRQRLWWRKDDAVVIPVGTDTERFRPMDRSTCREQLKWPPGAAVLFNAGNPKLKRLDLAEAALELVQRQVPDARLVPLRGQVPPDEMPVLINAADLVLLCSDAEGSPTMVKEAMACNVPVVSNDVGDVVRQVQGVHPGAVVAQEPAAFAEAMLAVLHEDRRSNGREVLVQRGHDSRMLDARVADLLKQCSWHRKH